MTEDVRDKLETSVPHASLNNHNHPTNKPPSLYVPLSGPCILRPGLQLPANSPSPLSFVYDVDRRRALNEILVRIQRVCFLMFPSLPSSLLSRKTISEEASKSQQRYVLRQNIGDKIKTEGCRSSKQRTPAPTTLSLYISGNAIPEHLRAFSSGTYTTETIRWHHQSASAPLSLLSPTFVSLFLWLSSSS